MQCKNNGIDEKRLGKRIEHFLMIFSKRQYSDKNIEDAENKAVSEYKEKLQGIWDKVRVLFIIAKHPKESGPQIISMAAAVVIYLVSPLDAIPDLIPGLGLVDDIAAIALIIGAIGKLLARLSPEKISELRLSIPDDLKPTFDSMFNLEQDGNDEIHEHPVFSRIRAAISSRYINPKIEKEVTSFLDKLYQRTLVSSLVNLFLYIFSVLLVMFPIFGTVPSSIISSLLLIASIAFFIYRIIRCLRNGYTIPIIRNTIRERSLKKGIAASIPGFLRHSDKHSLRMIPAAAEFIDGFLSRLNLSENRNVFERFVDYAYSLEKKNIIRFCLVWICIVIGFALLRYYLISNIAGLSAFEIIFYPFIALADSV